MLGKDRDGTRALFISLPKSKQLETAERIVEQQLPVRETEALVRALIQSDGKESLVKPSKSTLPASLLAIKESIMKIFGEKTQIKPKANNKGGVVSFTYTSEEELQQVIARFSGK